MPPIRSIPIEGMRPGALPVSDTGPRDPNQVFRRFVDRQPGANADEIYPPRRTCRCGAEMVVPSRADREHRVTCGEPDPVPEDGDVRVPENHCSNANCGRAITYGATYCSRRCQYADPARLKSRHDQDGDPD